MNYPNKGPIEEFITNFDVQENANDETTIIIHYANGTSKTEVYPKGNTSERIKQLLKQIKSQVLASKDTIDAFEKKYTKCIFSVIALALLTCASIALLIGTIINSLPLIPLALVVPFSAILAYAIKETIKTKNSLDDIDKNISFVEHMDILGKVKFNQKVLGLVSRKTRQIIGTREQLDLNLIHNISPQDTATIISYEEPKKIK